MATSIASITSITMLRGIKIHEISSFIIIALVILTSQLLHADSATSSGSREHCTSLKNCAECIQQAGCAWCADSKYEDRNHPVRSFLRCQYRDRMPKECSSYIQDPHSAIKVARNKNLTFVGTPVLISPQEINLTLRVNEPVTFTMNYMDPGDKPLDLFYLMDLSATMKDDRDTVSTQGSKLATSLGKLTKELRLGFGSFIDKPMIPMATKKQLDGKEENVTIPYSFKVHLKLSTDQSKFAEEVKNAAISTNSDRPEGTLDALMQAMACSKDVGWRNGSKKLIVVSTDGLFHIAGDGKLAGIIRPNDMKCHMENNTYTKFNVLDYPSIAQIDDKARKENVYLVFAVTKDMIPMYTRLKEKLTSASVVELAKDSSNVVQVITDEYKKIIGEVEIRQQPPRPEGLLIMYSYNCNNTQENREWYNGISKLICPIQPEGKLRFQITVKLTSCTNIHKTVQISTGDRQSLKLNIEPICNCDCEKTKDDPVKSPLCNDKGHLKCGQCVCDPDRRGRNCECDKKGDDKYNSNSCRKNNVTTEDVCSGNGVCECDLCKCNELASGLKYSGEFCQYDDLGCKNGISNGVSCSGHGDCVNGKCECEDGYSGTLCNCELDREQTICKEPGEETACNGRGQCDCPEGPSTSIVKPQCVCNQDGYTGKYCHVPTGTASKGSKCSEPNILECIKCIVDKEGLLSAKDGIPKQCKATCNAKTENKTIEFRTEIVDTIRSDSSRDVLCDLKDKENCKVNYLYYYTDNVINVRVFTRREGDCPEVPYWIIATVVGSIVLIGILTLLIWKVFTHIQDSREYQRFEKEREEGKWSKATNPLYENPMAEFQNPAYRGAH